MFMSLQNNITSTGDTELFKNEPNPFAKKPCPAVWYPEPDDEPSYSPGPLPFEPDYEQCDDFYF